MTEEKINYSEKGLDAITKHSFFIESIGNEISTTLGPMGMDKMIVYTSSKKLDISNDGATIIKKMNIDHYLFPLLKDVVKTQDNEVGDGTTTSIVLCGALLGRSRELRSKPFNLHPQKIIRVYTQAIEKAKEFYKTASFDYKQSDLEKVIRTILSGKLANNEILIKKLCDNLNNLDNKKDIIVTTIPGSSINDLNIIPGLIIDKEIIHKDMPRQKKNANVLLLNKNLEYKVDNASTNFNINNVETAEKFWKLEEQMSKAIVKKLKDSKVDVILFTGSVSDLVKHFLNKEGIIAIRRLNESKLNEISNAIGGRIVASIENIQKEDLGIADFNTEVKNDEEFSYLVSKKSKIKSILVRGTNEEVINETVRGIEDVVKTIYSINKTKKLLVGAGSCELFVANKLREYSQEFEGIEQIIYSKVAEAIEYLPMYLTVNSGDNDFSVFLKAKAMNKKNKNIGIDVLNCKANDMSYVLEPLSIKLQALDSAMELTKLILKADNVIIGNLDLKE